MKIAGSGILSRYPVALASAWRKTTLTYLRASKYSTRTRWTGTTAFPLSLSLSWSCPLITRPLSTLCPLFFSFASSPSLYAPFISSPSWKHAMPELERISMQPNRYDNYYRGEQATLPDTWYRSVYEFVILAYAVAWCVTRLHIDHDGNVKNVNSRVW